MPNTLFTNWVYLDLAIMGLKASRSSIADFGHNSHLNSASQLPLLGERRQGRNNLVSYE